MEPVAAAIVLQTGDCGHTCFEDVVQRRAQGAVCPLSGCVAVVLSPLAHERCAHIFSYRFRGPSRNAMAVAEVCCFCSQQLNEYGNNAAPLKQGQCCDSCNMRTVVPVRMKQMQRMMQMQSALPPAEAGRTLKMPASSETCARSCMPSGVAEKPHSAEKPDKPDSAGQCCSMLGSAEKPDSAALV